MRPLSSFRCKLPFATRGFYVYLYNFSPSWTPGEKRIQIAKVFFIVALFTLQIPLPPRFFISLLPHPFSFARPNLILSYVAVCPSHSPLLFLQKILSGVLPNRVQTEVPGGAGAVVVYKSFLCLFKGYSLVSSETSSRSFSVDDRCGKEIPSST